MPALYSGRLLLLVNAVHYSLNVYDILTIILINQSGIWGDDIVVSKQVINAGC